MRNIKTCWLAIALVTACNSCTPAKFLCILEFPNYEQKFEFDFSKDKLKDRIIDAYTYDISVFRMLFGATSIQEKLVNSEYNQRVDFYLSKSNWDHFKSTIRLNTADTLNIIIAKHLSRKELHVKMVIEGNSEKSSLTIKKINSNFRKEFKKNY
jgi:hypothetical protein